MIIYGIKHLVIEDNTSMGNYESPWTWEILSTSQNCSMVTMMNKPMGCWGTLFQTNTVRFHGPGRSSPLVETTIGGVLMVILFAVFFFYLGCWWCLVEFCLVNWRLPPRNKKDRTQMQRLRTVSFTVSAEPIRSPIVPSKTRVPHDTKVSEVS